MIVVMQPEAGESAIAAVEAKIRAEGLGVHVSRGTERTLIGAIGDERKLTPAMFETLPGVERALHIVKPYKLVAREWHKASTIVKVARHPDRRRGRADDCRAVLGGNPGADASGRRGGRGRGCAPDARRRVQAAHEPVRVPGRGPRRLAASEEAAGRHGLPIVTELMDVRMLDTFLHEGVDVIQIGTRNMKGSDLLKEVGKVDVPVILKRGMSATISEWLMAAEYIAAGGNHRIVLCERGIRTFETAYRNVLDVTAIPMLKRETHLPVIVDPSHAGGKAWLVSALASAALAAGADGLLVELHPNPPEAWCDADQALTPAEFMVLMRKLGAVADAVGRSLAGVARVATTQAQTCRCPCKRE